MVVDEDEWELLKQYLQSVGNWCDSLRTLVEHQESDRDEDIERDDNNNNNNALGKAHENRKLKSGNYKGNIKKANNGKIGSGGSNNGGSNGSSNNNNPKDDALLYLLYVLEDSKSRLANRVRVEPLHQQLEVMASNLKSIAAVFQSSYEEERKQRSETLDDDENDNGEVESADRLIGWGEQLCPSGEIVLEDKHRIKAAACNGQRGLYVTLNGDVFSIGDNGTGMPSPASQGIEDATTPKVVGELVLERVLLGRRVVSVACGHLHSCALTQGGRLWSWGCGQYGRLGHGDEMDQPAPRLCESLLNWHVRAVACGGAHTVAVVSPSRVFSWGLGRHGRLGLGDHTEANHSIPQLVDVDSHMITMTDAYRAFFGADVPKCVQQARDEPVVSVACGWAFTLLLGANGTVRAFGAGKDGQCGILPAQDQFRPMVVPEITSKGVVQISCGYHHAIAITEDGSCFTWGMGEEGQLGLGRGTRVCHVPQYVECSEKFNFAVAGQFHSLCVDQKGFLWGWGSNLHGAVEPVENQNDEKRRIIWDPTRVKDDIDVEMKQHHPMVKHIAAGAHFTIAVLGTRTRRPGSILQQQHQHQQQLPMTGRGGEGYISMIDSPDSPSWTIPGYDFIKRKVERRAAAALVPQIGTGSFCGGRIGFWDNGRYIPRIGVLTSTGVLELYKELNANSYDRIVVVHGHDVEIQCKDNVLEAWRARPGQEYSLLLRMKLNTRIEALTWAHHMSKHAATDHQLYLGLMSNDTGEGRNSLVKGRRGAWIAAIGNALRITPELYMIYKERATRQEGIGLDVKRTLPTLLLFGKRGEPLYDQLREVLEVYQCYRPDVGYVQGMSYIAAMLCLHIPNDPYACFACLANLLASHHLFDFFRLGQAYGRISQYYEVLDLVLAKSSPKLWRKLNHLCVMDEIHVTCFQWLQTLFVRRLPLEQVTQLWDAFLCRKDTMVMIRACVALLLCMEKSILAVSQPEDMLLLLRSTHRLDELIKKTFTIVQVPYVAQEKLNYLVEPRS